MIKQLDVSNYETYIILGNNDCEKLEKRKVIVDVSLRFLEKNDACSSDDLQETVCYSSLLNFVDEKLKDANFNLVEKASQFLYDEISKYLNDETILTRVKVTKPSPPVENLGSAAFVCSDW
jgi:dihydroneopterin aldolase